jgi:putative endonuclease
MLMRVLAFGGRSDPTPKLSTLSPTAFVYLLRCADGSLYCGWATDVERRLKEHQEGRASRYTRSRLPVELAWSTAVESRSAALREEARIKRLPRAQKVLLTGG